MKPYLRKLIERYRDTATRLMPLIADHLGITLPISDIEWAALDVPSNGKIDEATSYFKHGFGISVKYLEGTIDFDLGPSGEIGGFDANRLLRFAQSNQIEIPNGHLEGVQNDIKAAHNAGEIRFSGYILYYLN